MVSKWIKYKDKVRALRKDGISTTVIHKEYGIPKSTLSGWLHDIKLTEEQKKKLRYNSTNGWIKGLEKAVIWHNQQKANRIAEARKQAFEVLSNIKTNDKNIIELALSFLYLGEGTKTDTTSLANSKPEILQFFIKALNVLYEIKPSTLKCSLHLRSDQKDQELKIYWSKQLKIPVQNFYKSLIDKRTIKSKTYPDYKGVCVIECGRVAIQRRLVFLSQEFCAKISTI